MIAKLFPELVEEVRQKVEAPHLQLTLAQSDRAVIPGSRVSLIVEVTLPAQMHVYAPDVKGYIPIAVTLQPSEDFEISAAYYPPAKILYLAAIHERVSVVEGTFRIVQDIKVASSKAIINSLGATGRTIQVAGTFRYQACDSSVCYPPTSVPVRWPLQLLPLDLQRSPEAIRHQ